MRRLTLFAMTIKGYNVIAAIHKKFPGLIASVISERDHGITNDYYNEIMDLCIECNIDFYNRVDHCELVTDYAVAISWRWIIRPGQSKLIVFHDSLLPRYRGFNPLVTALINGDTEIGVTAIHASKEFDKGDIIISSKCQIEYPITIREAIDATLPLYISLALEIAKRISHNLALGARPQDETEASYSLWRDNEDYSIDWFLQASTIKRTIDALGFPYEGACSTIDGKKFRLLKATEFDDVNITNRTPGKVIFIHDNKPVIVCGHGLLKIDELVDEFGVSALPLTKFRSRFK